VRRLAEHGGMNDVSDRKYYLQNRFQTNISRMQPNVIRRAINSGGQNSENRNELEDV